MQCRLSTRLVVVFRESEYARATTTTRTTTKRVAAAAVAVDGRGGNFKAALIVDVGRRDARVVADMSARAS